MHLNKHFIIFFTSLITFASSIASPVNNTVNTYTQPDGSQFTVKIHGDEWMKIRTTTDGYSIVKGEDGWWYYGKYDSNGLITNTGYKIGQPTPSDVLSSSRIIPHDKIRAEAKAKRSVNRRNSSKRLEYIRSLNQQTKSTGAIKEIKGLAILVAFSDKEFGTSKDKFEKLLNEKGYNGTGSAKDYFQDQFGDNWNFTFDVTDVVTLDNPEKYYGENYPTSNDSDRRPSEMIRDACLKADADVNFADYDMDGDGEVDNIYVFYAGEDEAANSEKTDLIWAHQWYVRDGANIHLTCDGVIINRYACSSELKSATEIVGIGTFCHEFSHTFGLADLYDTDYEDTGRWAAGVWRHTSLMDGGNYNNSSKTPPHYNCIEREMLGLSEAVILEEGKTYTLEPIHKNGMYCRLDTDTEGEYYLLECRSNENWDEYIGGNGLLIYHVDKNATDTDALDHMWNKWDLNTVNIDSEHQCADLIEADGRNDAFDSYEEYSRAIRNIKNIFFPLSDVTAMTPESHSDYKFWKGTTPPLSITGIKRDGENIVFTVTDNSQVAEVANVSNVTLYRFPDAITATFRASSDIPGCKAFIKWKKQEENSYTKAVEVPLIGENLYAYKIENLESGNTQYDIEIYFENGTSIGNCHKQSALTKRKPDINWPYLYFSDISSTLKMGDTLPLHIVNSYDAAEIVWSLDGNDINVRNDGLYIIEKGGALRADVIWKSGSADIIIKEIKVE